MTLAVGGSESFSLAAMLGLVYSEASFTAQEMEHGLALS